MVLTVARAPQLPKAGRAIAMASLAAIGGATLTPQPGTAIGSHFCLLCGPFGGVNGILNVFLFVPLGIGLALSGASGKRALFAACALSVLIETAQLAIPGRYSTIGDVVTNTAGGAFGFAAARYAFILMRPSARTACALSVAWSIVWLANQWIAAFAFSPAIPRSQYYGEIAPSLGDSEHFQGQVLGATIGSVRVPDAPFENSSEVRTVLLHGGAVTTTVAPAGTTDDIAPIVRVADVREREILLVAQNAERLIFGVRTGAAVLRLRPPIFAVGEVFPPVPRRESRLPTETITVAAAYSAREVRVSTWSKTEHDWRLPITTSLGWTLLSPMQWYIAGTNTESVLSVIWMACWLFPVGYWGLVMSQRAGARTDRKIRLAAMPIALVLLYSGLVVLPHLFGIEPAPLYDWFAATTGLGLGAAIASRNATGIHPDR